MYNCTQRTLSLVFFSNRFLVDILNNTNDKMSYLYTASTCSLSDHHISESPAARNGRQGRSGFWSSTWRVGLTGRAREGELKSLGSLKILSKHPQTSYRFRSDIRPPAIKVYAFPIFKLLSDTAIYNILLHTDQ